MNIVLMSSVGIIQWFWNMQVLIQNVSAYHALRSSELQCNLFSHWHTLSGLTNEG